MWTVCEADLPKLSVMVSSGKLSSKIAILIAYFYATVLKSNIYAHGKDPSCHVPLWT